jgi:hypothetical protein
MIIKVKFRFYKIKYKKFKIIFFQLINTDKKLINLFKF